MFGVQTLRDDERKLLSMIYTVVREADLTELSDWADDNADAVRRLAACTARLWAETFRGFHISWILRWRLRPDLGDTMIHPHNFDNFKLFGLRSRPTNA
ncbi:hypothetical protein N7471_006787 [Penicillium samsonianum]|uniref:uncharacterized protein n=1 Tax=Penicillium samsonianum TaxID=1882272 RepID=UPI002547B00B|nr:uncharacterized protein N7471_006787 [Penicillium samsonianum]KAJ6140301.1 hypothetical protein N7471_006787 [Penicillium samsonianum]